MTLSLSDSVVLISSDDVLSSTYTRSPFSDGTCEYPSVEHFVWCQTLGHVGLIAEAQKILDIRSPSLVATAARVYVEEKILKGAKFDDAWNQYLSASRDTYTRQALRLRFQRDPLFARRLVDTGQALLVICDPNNEVGVGMDVKEYQAFQDRESLSTSEQLSIMMETEGKHAKEVGRNRLGVLLMSLREEAYKALQEAHNNQSLTYQRLYRVPFGITDCVWLSEQVLSLTGIFRPLSNSYAVPIVIKSKRYRSVEHFVYQKLLKTLKFGDKALERLRTTSDPSCVPQTFVKVLQLAVDGKLEEVTLSQKATATALFDPEAWVARTDKMNSWYSRAIRAKFDQHPGLKRLLLATGNAILVEVNNPDDLEWSCGTSEREMQHLMTKKYIGPVEMLQWMRRKKGGDEGAEEQAINLPRSVRHLGCNRCGLALMQLRELIIQENRDSEDDSDSSTDALAHCSLQPLLLRPASDRALIPSLSEHIICFTSDSVFHPIHPMPILDENNVCYTTVQHFIISRACKFFDLPDSISQWIMEAETGHEASVRLHSELNNRFPPFEKLYTWEFNEHAEAMRRGLRMRLEQNPSLLRVLLDTGDALLVFCQRFLTAECDWSIGMREKELRFWLHVSGMSTGQLAELCSLPLRKRPCYIGGNRMGCILMELRREFALRGIVPNNLPPMTATAELLLGSDSPAEDMSMLESFDPTSEEHLTAIWPVPLLLQAKTSDDDVLWDKLRKRPKPMPNVQGVVAASIMSTHPSIIEGPVPSNIDLETVDVMNESSLKVLLVALIAKLRRLKQSTQTQRRNINMLTTDIDTVRNKRREFERMLNKETLLPAFAEPKLEKIDEPVAVESPKNVEESNVFEGGSNRQTRKDERRREKRRGRQDEIVIPPLIRMDNRGFGVRPPTPIQMQQMMSRGFRQPPPMRRPLSPPNEWIDRGPPPGWRDNRPHIIRHPQPPPRVVRPAFEERIMRSEPPALIIPPVVNKAPPPPKIKKEKPPKTDEEQEEGELTDSDQD